MLENKLEVRSSKLEARRKKFFILLFTYLLPITYYLLPCYGQDEFTYDAKGKRNPFIPLVTSDGRILKLDKEEEGSGGLAIEGIIYDKHGVSYAIVNGEVLKTADAIAGFQVLKIEEDKVIFIKDGQPLEVELKKEDR